MTLVDAIALAQQSTTGLIVAVLALVGVTVVGGVIILAVRRHATSDRAAGSHESLSLAEIRDLHARCELTDEEYAALRAAALGAFGYASPDAAEEAGEERRAPPGVDLAGDPLPGFEPGDDPDEGPDEDSEGGSGNRQSE